jgi:hypothetical protein
VKTKTTVVYILIFLNFVAYSQNPIVAIDATMSDKSQGTYFKDLDNEFEKFEGTWLYENGNTSLKIVLEKEEQKYSDGVGFYFDTLMGEYQYIENGVEQINTLGNLGLNPLGYERSIGGGMIIPNNLFLKCDDCAPNERRVMLYISDPQREYLNYAIVLRYLIGQTNLEKMTVTIFAEDGAMLPTPNAPTSLRVPDGEYLMEKQ